MGRGFGCAAITTRPFVWFRLIRRNEAANLLEQAAKEVGGAYSGRSGIATGPVDDAPCEPRSPGKDHLAELGARYDRVFSVVH